MHAGNADRSFRLARTLMLLKSCGARGCTTAEIQAWSNSMAPATDISELRANGYDIPKPTSTVRNRRRVFRYVYRGKKAT
jgi:hypothetical protein